MVNDEAFEAEARRPDPERLVAAYQQSASTLNLLRAFTKGGFADLSQVHLWNQQFVASSTEGQRYERIASEIDRALRFMAACGIDLGAEEGLHQVDFFTSHEALILPYEECLTRVDSLTGDWYDCSAHMVWVGDRTRQLDGAHVEFLSGINNPVGAKVGPGLQPRRGGGALRASRTPTACRAASRSSPVSAPRGSASCSRPWCGRWRPRAIPSCGPATPCTATRSPATAAARPGASTTSWPSCAPSSPSTATRGRGPGGVHVELTGDDVTECLGGAEEILEGDLDARYTTTCDPRLNARQSLDLAFRVAEFLRS